MWIAALDLATASTCDLTDRNIRQEISSWIADRNSSEGRCGHISEWNTSKITDMSWIFCHLGEGRTHTRDGIDYCGENMTGFNEDLSRWDTSLVTNLKSAFSNNPSFNGDISSWNVGKVTDMAYMFKQTRSFNRSLSSWNVSKLELAYSMFESSSFNGALNGWDVGNLKNMQSMFSDTSAFNRRLDSWNTVSVTTMRFAFRGSLAFNQDVSTWSLASLDPDGLEGCFTKSQAFRGNLNGWDLAGVTMLDSMFYESNFNGIVSEWDTSRIRSMRSVFYDSQFNGDLSSWNVGAVTNMDFLFAFADRFNGDLSRWDTSQIETMDRIFVDAYVFNGDIGSWNVARCRDLYLAFYRTEAFDRDLSNWNVDSVTDMRYAFTGTNLSDCNKWRLYDSWSTSSPGWPSMYDGFAEIGDQETCGRGDSTDANNDNGSGAIDSAHVAVIVGTVALVIVCTALILWRVCRSLRKSREEQKNLNVEMNTKLAQHRMEFESRSKAWYLRWGDVKIMEQIARGTYGEVAVGTYMKKWKVAVKLVPHKKADSLINESEFRVLQRARHPRLVMFFGAGNCDDDDDGGGGGIFLVLEYMDGGTLEDALMTTSNSLPWRLRMSILLDVVEGMAFLHSIGIAHRDLKCANVMLSHVGPTALRAKVSDFGLSSALSELGRTSARKNDTKAAERTNLSFFFSSKTDSTQTRSKEMSTGSSMSSVRSTTPRGTPLFMAPEILRAIDSPDVSSTAQVDMYAFGIIMWMVLTRREPWENLTYIYQICEAVVDGERPKVTDVARSTVPKDSKPSACDFEALMRRAWHQDPLKRPLFSDVRDDITRSWDMPAWRVRKEGTGVKTKGVSIDVSSEREPTVEV